jgi:hypothetical protein
MTGHGEPEGQMRETDWRSREWLTSAEEVARLLPRLSHRTGRLMTLDILFPEFAVDVLRELSRHQLLVVAAAAGPGLFEALRTAVGYQTGLWTLTDYVGSDFPPAGPIPSIPDGYEEAVQQLALGGPGDRVAFGLFPSPCTKLARLLLAAERRYPADVVRPAAERAYDRNRPYYAHDAFACALVHPEVDAADLAERYGSFTRHQKGHRARHKIHQLLAWARRTGYLPDPSGCACGHHRVAAPATVPQALALAGHWTGIESTLDVVAIDDTRWLRVLRCPACGELWAEDSISSGHADLIYGYPIRTGDPVAWLRVNESLTLRRW